MCSNCRGKRNKRNKNLSQSSANLGKSMPEYVRTYSGPGQTKLHIVGSKSDSFAEGGGRQGFTFCS